MPNILITIQEYNPFYSLTYNLAKGDTDKNGEFEIDWIVRPDSLEKEFDIQAVYDFNEGRYPSSKLQKMDVLIYLSSLTLDEIPQSAEIGETIFFTGKLELESGSTEGHVVYIKDEDPFDTDDLLATAYVESDGSFSANWLVMNTDDDRVSDIYAVFEGAGYYARSTTCDIGTTSTFNLTRYVLDKFTCLLFNFLYRNLFC